MPFGKRAFQYAERFPLIRFLFSFEFRLDHAEPDQRLCSSIVRDKGQAQRRLVVLVEFGPIHGHFNLRTVSNHERNVRVEQRLKRQLFIGQKAIHLLFAVLCLFAKGPSHRQTHGGDPQSFAKQQPHNDQKQRQYLLVMQLPTKSGFH